MGLIAWFARNRVAANFVMVLIVVVGFLQLSNIPLRAFPEFSPDLISVFVPYLGAAPEEVETAVCTRIEERLLDLESVSRIRSIAAEGGCTATVELLPGVAVERALNDVRTRVDTIDSFPQETEKPIVEEVSLRQQVLNVAVWGSADEGTLKRLGEQIREEILELDGITQVELAGVRPYEISIEVSERALRRYGLTFDDVADAVRRSSIDLPGGSLRTRAGDFLVRTQGQARRGSELEELMLLTRPDGTRLTLGEVASVVDGFADVDLQARFDGHPAVMVQVYRAGDRQQELEIADRVASYVEEARERLPEGIELTIWQDYAQALKSRIGTLLRNGRSGFVLVLVILALALRLRLAGWVALGIPVSFLGALGLLSLLGLAIDMMSLLGFIVVLGIVVDDAVVVGESIYRQRESGGVGTAAAIAGVREVVVPVTFSSLTTIAAFVPLLLIPGTIGDGLRPIPIVVIATLVVSFVESFLVLPAHLSHLPSHSSMQNAAGQGSWGRIQAIFDTQLGRLASRFYRPMIEKALSWRYSVAAAAVTIFLLAVSSVAAGLLKFSFFPAVDADSVVAFLTLPEGTPLNVTGAALDRIETSADMLKEELAREGHREAIQHILTTTGDHPYRNTLKMTAGFVPTGISASHLGEVRIELAPSDDREVSASEIVRRWRQLTGSIPDAVELSFSSTFVFVGEAINVQLEGHDLDLLRQAGSELKQELARFPGVVDLADSIRSGKGELRLDVTPVAEALGISRRDLARQVRQAFYGEEVQRFQRGRDDVRVMVRYPAAGRRSMADLSDMWIWTPAGNGVPMAVAGKLTPGRGYATIQRTNGKRTVNVLADVDPSIANGNVIMAEVERTVLPEILGRYPGLGYSLSGEQEEQRKSATGLMRSFVMILFLIYALLAVPLRSYVQPLIVMSVIPFGIVGAFLGHALMGMELTLFSTFGIVALTGVVVNDSLVLVDFVNRALRAGTPLIVALRDAGLRRFRPILLTSFTTFAGLTPLLFEGSLQAQFLKPLAVSLGFGVLFATLITLVLVPVAFAIHEDIRAGVLRLWRPARSMKEGTSETH